MVTSPENSAVGICTHFNKPLAATLLVLACAPMLQAWAGEKKLYCWEQGGKKVCSDTLPPEQAAAARVELSSTDGRTLDAVARALTPEERRAAAEAKRLADAQADIDRASARRDQAMVESYTSEADLRRAFGERIILVEESIKGSVLAEENLRRGLVSQLSRASDLELAGKPVPQKLQDNIARQHDDLSRLLAQLQQQRGERGVLTGEFNAALQRYRDLKAQRQPAEE